MPPRRHTRSLKQQRGFVEMVAIAIMFAILLFVAAGVIASRAGYQMAETADRVRQSFVDRRSLSNAVRDALLARVEVSPTSSSESLDNLLDAWCTSVNANAQGITLTRNAASPSISGIRAVMFPSSGAPALSNLDLAIEGHSFQYKSFLSGGAALAGPRLPFSFRKTVTANAAEGQIYSIEAQVYALSLANWSLIAYGLPASGTVPSAAPSGAASLLGSVAFTTGGGRAGLLTTLRPSPAYSNGDPTAYNQLYTPPASGRPETLPSFYSPQTSAFWNAWEFVWAGGSWPLTTYNDGFYQDRLLNYASQSTRNTGVARSTSAVTDLSAFQPTTQTGVTTVGTTTTVNLATYPEDILYLVDGTGAATVNLTGAATNAAGPLVIVIANQNTATRTRVNLSGTNQRTTLIYSRRCDVRFAAGTQFNGGLYLDPQSIASGTLTLTGIFAFYAPAASNPLTTASLSLIPPTGSVLTDLRAIAPRIAVVSTFIALN